MDMDAGDLERMLKESFGSDPRRYAVGFVYPEGGKFYRYIDEDPEFLSRIVPGIFHDRVMDKCPAFIVYDRKEQKTIRYVKAEER